MIWHIRYRLNCIFNLMFPKQQKKVLNKAVVSKCAYKLIRDVTTEECGWLRYTFYKGQIVYRYSGPTFGCISRLGTAFTLVEEETPFFELPNNAVVLVAFMSSN